MIKCTKCNEVLGDNLKECLFCKHVITDEERKNAIAEYERLHQEAIENSIKEYSKRFMYEIIVSVLMVVIALVGITLMCIFESVIWLIIMFLIICLICVLGIFKLRIGCCPYCESPMGRGSLFNTYCSRCGGRIR